MQVRNHSMLISSYCVIKLLLPTVGPLSLYRAQFVLVCNRNNYSYLDGTAKINIRNNPLYYILRKKIIFSIHLCMIDKSECTIILRGGQPAVFVRSITDSNIQYSLSPIPIVQHTEKREHTGWQWMISGG